MIRQVLFDLINEGINYFPLKLRLPTYTVTVWELIEFCFQGTIRSRIIKRNEQIQLLVYLQVIPPDWGCY